MQTCGVICPSVPFCVSCLLVLFLSLPWKKLEGRGAQNILGVLRVAWTPAAAYSLLGGDGWLLEQRKRRQLS